MNEASPIPIGENAPETQPTPQTPPPRRGGTMKGDLTQGPILGTLLTFSVPMLISSILQTLNGSINAIWVGRLLGESALAATANANIIMFLLIALVIGFGTATTVRVGQFFGARDIEAARRNFGTGIGFCILLGALTGVLGWVFTRDILTALGTPEASAELALAYLQVVFITIPFGVVSMMVSMGMRGAGDSKTPLYAMILTAAVDVVLNPLLIIGPGPLPTLGIAGSAAATAFANIAGLGYQLWRIYGQDLPLRLRGPELRYLIPQGEALRYIVAKGIPMGAQMVLVSSAGLVMVGLVNREGLNASAAYGASLQLWNYLQMPAFAVSSAVSAMVAQSLGAGNHKRVGDVTRVGLLATLAMSVVLAALIVLADRPLLALFLGSESPAMPIAQHIQLVCTGSFVIMCVTMILSGTMRAYGAVIMPMVIMFVALYPARLGFYYIAYPHIGGEAVWWAYPAGSVVAAGLTLAYYTMGRWRKTQVIPPKAGAPAA
ncbi:putative MATE family efflux protein [Novosphingobium chloroacetimidivorans]|uniref:Putative MATE family efflux protein n=1 Tax=Novosphingobium chloroacetimidivorans TaxID=1428314 RepID=A0A7W7NZ90_9SPHN|nr:MATE family efflux transporter [Novosphingobium chloroacetimidivorans]MBB4860977.1 putative MATE family efflux protein [Novosphingobium chloroacetimidivorans]